MIITNLVDPILTEYQCGSKMLPNRYALEGGGKHLQQKLYDYYSNVCQREIDWLWFPYIPYGKLTVLQGDPGDGKSTFILQIAALLSKGLPMPDGYRVKEKQSSIYQCSEDDLADTIKPRLVAAGADCSRIAFIEDDDERLTLEDKRIEKTLEATQARLLVIDPIQAYMTQDYDMQNATRIRSVLGGLSDLAGKYRCAVVLVGHMNKSTGGKDLYRGLGSIDIAAIARSVLMIVRDKENPKLRYMLPVKSSLAPEGSAIAFSFTREAGFQWNGPCNVDVNTLLENESDRGSKLSTACKYLDEALSLRDMSSKEVYDQMARKSIGKRTVANAKQMMKITSYKKNNVWFWKLPTHFDQETLTTGGKTDEQPSA